MIAKQVLNEIEGEMKKAIEATKREFAELRSGRANPKMVEGVRIDYYGTPTLLKELALISVPEARMVVISPYDPTSLKEIEKTILQSDLGITPVNDGKIIRLIVPPLSQERREEPLDGEALEKGCHETEHGSIDHEQEDAQRDNRDR